MKKNITSNNELRLCNNCNIRTAYLNTDFCSTECLNKYQEKNKLEQHRTTKRMST